MVWKRPRRSGGCPAVRLAATGGSSTTNPVRHCAGPATPADLAAFEARIGHPLPLAYRSFLANSNGGVPHRTAFHYLLSSGQPRKARVAAFAPVSAEGWDEVACLPLDALWEADGGEPVDGTIAVGSAETDNNQESIRLGVEWRGHGACLLPARRRCRGRPPVHPRGRLLRPLGQSHYPGEIRQVEATHKPKFPPEYRWLLLQTNGAILRPGLLPPAQFPELYLTDEDDEDEEIESEPKNEEGTKIRFDLYPLRQSDCPEGEPALDDEAPPPLCSAQEMAGWYHEGTEIPGASCRLATSMATAAKDRGSSCSDAGAASGASCLRSITTRSPWGSPSPSCSPGSPGRAGAPSPPPSGWPIPWRRRTSMPSARRWPRARRRPE